MSRNIVLRDFQQKLVGITTSDYALKSERQGKLYCTTELLAGILNHLSLVPSIQSYFLFGYEIKFSNCTRVERDKCI
jgi:hypothetical protein